MLTRWNELDSTFALMDELRRRMDRTFEYAEPTFAQWFGGASTDGWPRVAIYDAGDNLVVQAELPGVDQKSLDLSLHQDVLTMSGKRTTRAPEGFTAHRQERGAMSFSKSFSLPQQVDGERVTAEMKSGVLTVTLPKHPASKPRQITVTAS
jgi:HSP20 family protein